MNIYYAPLEGITGYLYRRAHHDFYPGITKYFIPYLEPHEKRSFNARERNDISLEHNDGMQAVPQILTRNAEGFIRMAYFLRDAGYSEINLNLGCPSGTVVSKGKGAGFLGYPEELDHFLEQIYADAPCEISIKTRIGRYDDDEWEELLSIYQKYPVKELIVHPRTREDYYKYPTRPDAFAYAAEHCTHPLCYNGNIFDTDDYHALQERFPDQTTWMLGRGLMINPQLAEQMETGNAFDFSRFCHFYQRIYQDYCEIMPGNQPLLMKMKELWFYWMQLFPENKKLEKQLKKARNKSEYEAAVQTIFSHYGK